MNRKRRIFVLNFLMGLDAFMTVSSFVGAYIFRNKFPFFDLEALLPFSIYFPYMGLILAVWLLLLQSAKCYSFVQDRRGVVFSREMLSRLFFVEGVGMSVLAMVLFFLRDSLISRTFLGFFGLLNFISLVGIRLVVLGYFRRMGKGKKYHRRVLVLGTEEEVRQFTEIQAKKPELFLDIVKPPEFSLAPRVSWKEEEWQTFHERMLDFILNNVIDEVLFAFADLNLFQIVPLINDCGRLGITVDVILNTSDIKASRTEVDVLGPFNIVSFQSYDYSPLQRFFKRLIDIVSGLTGSFIFCILFLFLGPLIKITSPGPVLFRQFRKGKNGREFQILKFRTMYSDAEKRKKDLRGENEMKGHIFKIQNDPRITPLGSILRKTSLDEFPQFINILKGEMSLVGTRPPTIDEFNSYEVHHRRRLSIQPGLTGLWQVSGRNKISDFEKIVQLDTDYIDNWSLWLDIKIILKTFGVLFSGR